MAQLCLTLFDPMDYSLLGSSVHRDSPGKNTGVGCYVILQGISPTQGSNSGPLHCRLILYHLSHQGSQRCRRRWCNSWVGKILWRRDRLPTPVFLSFPCGSAGRESTSNAGDLQKTSVRSLGWENFLEKGKATHSNSLAWRIPWTV